ncbi:hypothetical protein [Pediococcus argentinicus]|uniref:Uncharacterized protein n=1 Tax=Pediococcus argentinicus TaxID=480391 RepID=A0A0R2N4X8_9LACO|nr:hypothetical protein [Pediococcus argentinicus]KRO20879.1 hypothetical protein IV88_GL001481 [Pediococcus argentinicus]NKZ23164.1 hypothetical protein [Pediococcus argentinicus]GEP20350.1 hypothetical protein LSA03_17340 [Pediococcus argentinicus]
MKKKLFSLLAVVSIMLFLPVPGSASRHHVTYHYKTQKYVSFEKIPRNQQKKVKFTFRVNQNKIRRYYPKSKYAIPTQNGKHYLVGNDLKLVNNSKYNVVIYGNKILAPSKSQKVNFSKIYLKKHQTRVIRNVITVSNDAYYTYSEGEADFQDNQYSQRQFEYKISRYHVVFLMSSDLFYKPSWRYGSIPGFTVRNSHGHLRALYMLSSF